MPSESEEQEPNRLVTFDELHQLFPQLIRAAFPNATDEQMASAQRLYDDQLSALAGSSSTDAVFTIDQAVEALRGALDRLG
jgi:hypothetical protein